MIKELIEGSNPTRIQQTSFTYDFLGRYICNTWDEAAQNSGEPFDAIIIGAGMFGAYCAEKIYRMGESKNTRILVLEEGAFLASEHVQNLSRIGIGVPKAGAAGTTPYEEWGVPWLGTAPFPGLAYCIGGRSLFWGGWAPRLTNNDLSAWPTQVSNYLQNTYLSVEREIGVQPATDFISGTLYNHLISAVNNVKSSIPGLTEVGEAPIAVQGQAPVSGLFSFDKYSSAPILIDAVREAAESPDSTRRIFIVPRTHVIRLNVNGGTVTSIEVNTNGQQETLNISPDCAVVLAAGTIESTRLALHSFPTQKMGSNLSSHLRSNIYARIRRTEFPGLPLNIEPAALIVRGETAQGSFHIQITASSVPGNSPNSETNIFRMIPDIDLVDAVIQHQDPDWVVLTLRTLGEKKGSSAGMDQSSNWINLSPFDKDKYGIPLAWVNLVETPDDSLLWTDMDNAAILLAQKLAQNDPNNIQFFYTKSGDNNADWHNTPPTSASSAVRDGLGTTHHEAGTLWIGDNPNTSVTDLDGRFHHISNAYVAGLALYPTIGSANPALTALALARKTAASIVNTVH